MYQLYDLARSVSVPIEQIGRPHTGIAEAAAGVLRGRRLRRDHDTTGGVLGQVRVPEAAAGIVNRRAVVGIIGIINATAGVIRDPLFQAMHPLRVPV